MTQLEVLSKKILNNLDKFENQAEKSHGQSAPEADLVEELGKNLDELKKNLNPYFDVGRIKDSDIPDISSSLETIKRTLDSDSKLQIYTYILDVSTPLRWSLIGLGLAMVTFFIIIVNLKHDEKT